MSYYDSKREKVVTKSWPKGNGGDTPKRAASRAEFANAVKLIKITDGNLISAAVNVSSGTNWLWRDLTMAAIYGKLTIVKMADGRIFRSGRIMQSEIQAMLNSISSVPGATLVRTDENWMVLLPGMAEQVLTMDPATGLPNWLTIGGGGGGNLVLEGAGAPNALEPVGRLYSQTDEPALWVSSPTVAGGTAVVQSASHIGGSETPGSYDLPAAPVPGNLLISFIAWGDGNLAGPTVSSDWATFATVMNGSNVAALGIYRYVQSGDTKSLPNLCSAGSAYWAGCTYEVSGVSGVIADDIEDFSDAQGYAASLTPASMTVASDGALALSMGGNYDGNADQTISTGWTVDQAQHNAGNFGSVLGASNAALAAGTNVHPTMNFAASSHSATMLNVIIKGSSGGLVAGWTKIGP